MWEWKESHILKNKRESGRKRERRTGRDMLKEWKSLTFLECEKRQWKVQKQYSITTKHFSKWRQHTNSRRRQWHPTPVLLTVKSHGRRSLEGCSPWGPWGSNTTERLHFHFSLSCIGEGNGNPLQCFCLENPRDGRAWWAALYGVSQSRTWLKWLSSIQIQEA